MREVTRHAAQHFDGLPVLGLLRTDRFAGRHPIRYAAPSGLSTAESADSIARAPL